ncbi:MAG: glycosyltransferase, partial [Caldilineaceae bacterium]|nr:glycosyltransferase [Caldilineaceae bacterium]
MASGTAVAVGRVLVDPVTNPSAQDETVYISVVVPARNEESTIDAVVRRSFAAFNELGRRGEVLVVNDGSTDG